MKFSTMMTGTKLGAGLFHGQLDPGSQCPGPRWPVPLNWQPSLLLGWVFLIQYLISSIPWVLTARFLLLSIRHLFSGEGLPGTFQEAGSCTKMVSSLGTSLVPDCILSAESSSEHSPCKGKGEAPARW